MNEESSANEGYADIIGNIDVEVEQPAILKLEDQDSDFELALLRPFGELTTKDRPLKKIPDMYRVPEVAEIHRYTEKRCHICTAPKELRQLVEGVYLESGRKPMEVMRFFAEYYGVSLRHQQVSTHMEHHCDLSRVVVSGLRAYEKSEVYHDKYRYRERDLVAQALISELDTLGGMDCKGHEAKIRRALAVDKLGASLIKIQKERDEAANSLINWFDVIRSLHAKITDPVSKQIVRDEIERINAVLTRKRP